MGRGTRKLIKSVDCDRHQAEQYIKTLENSTRDVPEMRAKLIGYDGVGHFHVIVKFRPEAISGGKIIIIPKLNLLFTLPVFFPSLAPFCSSRS
jgi:hypothetical protein